MIRTRGLQDADGQNGGCGWLLLSLLLFQAQQGSCSDQGGHEEDGAAAHDQTLSGHRHRGEEDLRRVPAGVERSGTCEGWGSCGGPEYGGVSGKAW